MFLFSVNAADVNLSGVIRNSVTKKPISGAIVNLKGFFSFNIINDKTVVRVDIYNLSGLCVATLVDKILNKGYYQYNLMERGLSSQFYLVKLRTNTLTSFFELPFISGNTSISKVILQKADANSFQSVLAKSTAENDTIVVTKAGYKTMYKEMTSLTETLDILLLSQCFWLFSSSFFRNSRSNSGI